jgi:hypothetical protein
MKAGIQGIIFTLITTLVIFGLVKKDNIGEISFPKSFILRFLSSNKTTEQLTEDMCSKSSSDLKEFYEITPPNYVFNISNRTSVMKDIIKNVILNSTNINLGPNEIKNYVIDYVKESPKYIMGIVIFVLFSILWVPYCLCICCKCCLCCPDCCLKCPNVFIFCGIALCALILINCFIGYSENNSLVNGIYGIGCSVLKIEQHLIKGDEYTKEPPYWMGINGIISKLSETGKNISSLGIKTKDLRDQLNTVNELLNTFSENVANEYNVRKDSVLKNPIPGKDDFNPTYFGLYGPADKKNTTLYLVSQEISKYHDYTFQGIDTVISVIENATSQTTTITEKIEEISKEIDTKVNDIDTRIANEIMKYDDYLDTVDSYSRNYMNLLFSIDLIIVLVIGVSLILLLLCKCGKCTLCVSWVFLYLLMLFSFLLGAIFGIVGSFIQEISGCAVETMRDLKSIDKIDDNAKNIVDICLNGNGSLAKASLISLDYNTEIIDNIYNLEVKINEGISLIEEYNPTSIKINEEKYNEISKRPKPYVTELQEALTQLQKYTDISKGDSYISSSTPKSDEWEINEKDCIYTYSQHNLTNQARRLSEEKQICLVLKEWSMKDIADRYKDTKLTDDTNITQHIEKYYNSINGFIKSNNELLTTIKDQNKAFNNSFTNIGKEEIKILEGIKGIILPFRDSYKEIVGDKSIFEMLNCNFLKRDVNKVVEVLYDSFGSSFQVTATLFIMISCYELAITLIVLIVIAALNKQQTKSEDIDFSKE